MSLNARPGSPFQKLNVSSSVVSISTQPRQLFSGLDLFNLTDRNKRLTPWPFLASGCQMTSWSWRRWCSMKKSQLCPLLIKNGLFPMFYTKENHPTSPTAFFHYVLSVPWTICLLWSVSRIFCKMHSRKWDSSLLLLKRSLFVQCKGDSLKTQMTHFAHPL